MTSETLSSVRKRKERVIGIMKIKRIEEKWESDIPWKSIPRERKKGISLKSILRLMTFAVCLWLGVVCRAEAAGTVLENDKFKLELVNDCSEIQLTEKATSYVWTSNMSDPNFDLDAMKGRWAQKMRSLYTISVTDLRKGVGSIVTYDQLGTEYTAVTYDTSYGIGVQYDVPAAGVKFCMEFALTDDGFSVKIPSEKLEEYGDFSMVSLDLMPFFAGAADNQDGYLFYPDGSGAIMCFDDPSHVNESAVTYNVYGDIQNNQNLKGRFEQEEASVLLPVYGANYGKKGFVAYITKGEETSRITVTPSTAIVKANYIYPTFLFRRGFNDPRVKGKVVQKYDVEQLMTEYEVHYQILPDGKAQYADMASAYREYLITNDLLAQSERNGLALSLDLFMGVIEEGLILDTFQNVTSFEQAQEILEDLKGSIDTPMEVSLIGWIKSGYGTEPIYFPANSKLGGNKGLDALAKYTRANGIQLSLGANFLTASAEASGYSQRTDIVFLGNYQVLTDKRSSIRVISPTTALKNFEKFMEKAQKFDIDGLKLENIGDMLYYNYNERGPVLVTECKENWKKMLADSKDAFGSVISEGGNLYVLEEADMVTKIPSEDLGYQMTTREVPFYQIVAHGSVRYTGEALNLSSDAEKLRLKWIEYGYTPYFELTYESAEKLVNTNYNELFTSSYKDWKDEIVATCQELKSAWDAIQDAKMVSHEEMAENVYCTGYDNGVKIYVNYNNKAVKVDGMELGAMSWEVSR